MGVPSLYAKKMCESVCLTCASDSPSPSWLADDESALLMDGWLLYKVTIVSIDQFVLLKFVLDDSSEFSFYKGTSKN